MTAKDARTRFDNKDLSSALFFFFPGRMVEMSRDEVDNVINRSSCN